MMPLCRTILHSISTILFVLAALIVFVAVITHHKGIALCQTSSSTFEADSERRIDLYNGALWIRDVHSVPNLGMLAVQPEIEWSLSRTDVDWPSQIPPSQIGGRFLGFSLKASRSEKLQQKYAISPWPPETVNVITERRLIRIPLLATIILCLAQPGFRVYSRIRRKSTPPERQRRNLFVTAIKRGYGFSVALSAIVLLLAIWLRFKSQSQDVRAGWDVYGGRPPAPLAKTKIVESHLLINRQGFQLSRVSQVETWILTVSVQPFWPDSTSTTDPRQFFWYDSAIYRGGTLIPSIPRLHGFAFADEKSLQGLAMKGYPAEPALDVNGPISVTGWVALFPHWAVILATSILPAFWLIQKGFFIRQFRRRRRIKLGLCTVCGYDLRATPDRCPECGNSPDHPKAATSIQPV